MTATRDTTIRYVNKDFQSFKRDLIRHAQVNFSGSFQDFNEASPGMAILEMQAYVADVLAFYLDQNFLEIKQETARQLVNIEQFAKMRGYRPKGKRAARVPLKFIFEIPATADSTGKLVPNPLYAPILKARTQVQGPNGIKFETLEDIDFANALPNDVVQSQPLSGSATHFAVRMEVEAIAGETKVDTFNVGDFEPFYKLKIGNSDVQEVLDVIDTDGYTWYEVDHLAQNAVFDKVTNTDVDSETVPYVLKMRTVSRRFVSDYVAAENATYLKFGSGQGLRYDDEFIPNVAEMAIPVTGKPTFTHFTLDPQNFLKTRSLGMSPSNTSLVVTYRVGGGPESNVPFDSIKKVTKPLIEFKSTALNPTAVRQIETSLECTNVVESSGGGDAETGAEIKANADSYFAAQKRCVVPEDFVTHILSIPQKFGRVEKVYVKPNDAGSSVNVYALSLDSDGNLTKPSVTLKKNIQTYLGKLRMMTEGIYIMPANVVNLGIQFGVVISPRYNRGEVLTECLKTLKTKFDIDNFQIGQSIVKSEVESVIQAVEGVVSVYKLEFSSLRDVVGGLSYSNDLYFDVNGNTKNGILYCPENTIFEVKHPNVDIIGESK